MAERLIRINQPRRRGEEAMTVTGAIVYMDRTLPLTPYEAGQIASIANGTLSGERLIRLTQEGQGDTIQGSVLDLRKDQPQPLVLENAEKIASVVRQVEEIEAAPDPEIVRRVIRSGFELQGTSHDMPNYLVQLERPKSRQDEFWGTLINLQNGLNIQITQGELIWMERESSEQSWKYVKDERILYLHQSEVEGSVTTSSDVLDLEKGSIKTLSSRQSQRIVHIVKRAEEIEATDETEWRKQFARDRGGYRVDGNKLISVPRFTQFPGRNPI